MRQGLFQANTPTETEPAAVAATTHSFSLLKKVVSRASKYPVTAKEDKGESREGKEKGNAKRRGRWLSQEQACEQARG